MFRRMLAGAAAGTLATIPQSAALWGLRTAGLYRRAPPPEIVSATITERATDEPVAAAPWFKPMMLAQHFAFGAAGGATLATLAGFLRPNALAGLFFGFAVWKLSYDGWIPALRIMPPAGRDERGRQGALVAAHAVYGVSLGALLEWMLRRR